MKPSFASLAAAALVTSAFAASTLAASPPMSGGEPVESEAPAGEPAAEQPVKPGGAADPGSVETAIHMCANPVQYEDSAHVGNPLCGSDYASGPMDDCHNFTAPPPPSILRNYIAPLNPARHPETLSPGAIAFPKSALGPAAPPEWPSILPSSRTSNDGRLAVLDGQSLGLFLPENLGPDLLRNPDPARPAVSPLSYSIHPYHLFNPHDTRLPVEESIGFTTPTDGSAPEPLDQVLWMPVLASVNLCDDSGSGFMPGEAPQLSTRRNPTPCSARYRQLQDTGQHVGDPADPIEGDCYDLTLQANVSACEDPTKSVYAPDCNHVIWEIRSSDVTVFVPDARRTDTGSWHIDGVQNPGNVPVWVYPRRDVGVTELPPFTSDDPDESYNLHATKWNSNWTEPQRCDGVGPHPVWCQFFWNQKHTPQDGFLLDADGDSEDDPAPWNGAADRGINLFEPATTGDGRLLIVNAMQPGLMYSYIRPEDGDACDASKWTTFRPLSRMPVDPTVRDRYEITRSLRRPDAAQKSAPGPSLPEDAQLFRDTLGDPIPAGAPIPGAYLWVDRLGRNLLFSHAPMSRTGYHAMKATGFCEDPRIDDKHCDAPVEFDWDPSNDLVRNPDRTSGKGQSILGAWTQGKIVHLDDALNMTDWGGQGHWFGNRYTYEMALYDACDAQGNKVPTIVRPKPNTEVFSLENQLNHFDAMSPTLPFDVVWRAQGNGGANAEIAFDDYLRNDALIVAHMNAAIDMRCGADVAEGDPDHDVKCSSFPKRSASQGQTLQPLQRANGRILDGFVPAHPWAGANDPAWNSGDELLVNPTLQNAATSSVGFDPNAVTPPSYLRLRGGARVEPINAGGVLGRGVYLDGRNDILDAAYPYQANRTEWWLGVWLDARDLTLLRTVFFFADESSIAIDGHRIVAHDGPRHALGLPGAEQTVPLPDGLIEEGKFFHLGVAITTESGHRVLRFTIDGVPMAAKLAYARADAAPLENGAAAKSADPGQPIPASAPLGFQIMTPGQPNGHTWFALGGCTTDWNKPFKGWVDELRVLALRPEEVAGDGSFHDELVCNQALGTLVDLSVRASETPSARLTAMRDRLALHGYTYPGSSVIGKPVRKAFCEQLDLVPDGTQGELPRQHDDEALCVHRVHANPTSDRCLRETALDITPIHADVPLPSFEDNAFCLGCHHEGAAVRGLGLTALAAGTAAAEADPRRRPMFWPAVVTGNQYDDPSSSTSRMPGWEACDPGTASCTALDRTFLAPGAKWYFP